MTIFRIAVCAAMLSALLAGCGNGRWDQEGSVANPSCAPDGSVVFYEYPNSRGSYDGLTNSPAHCPWSRTQMTATARR